MDRESSDCLFFMRVRSDGSLWLNVTCILQKGATQTFKISWLQGLWHIANIATFCVLYISKEQKKPREIKLGEDMINRVGTSHSKRAKYLIKLFRINERSLNTNIEQQRYSVDWKVVLRGLILKTFEHSPEKILNTSET